MKKKHVVIVGGGFGGLYTAKNLETCFENENFDVTLISDKNYFLFTPMIHEVATGGLDKNNVVLSIRSTLEHTKFINDFVKKIEFTKQTIYTNKLELEYDILILATGARNNYYGIKGASENTIPLKTLEDAINIKHKILDTIEEASKTNDKEKLKNLLSFSVVGGGPTGIELVTELTEFVHSSVNEYYPQLKESNITINLICGNAMLQYFSTESQIKTEKYLNEVGVKIVKEFVNEVRNTQIELKNGKKINSNTILWAAGVAPNLPEITPHPTLDNTGRLLVNEYLQVKNFDNVFAIGDIAAGWPMLAYTATRQSELTSKNIYNYLNKKNLDEFKFKPQAKLMSLGQKNAIGEILGYNLSGRAVWFLWRTVYLSKIISTKKKIKIAMNWTFNLFAKRDISQT